MTDRARKTASRSHRGARPWWPVIAALISILLPSIFVGASAAWIAANTNTSTLVTASGWIAQTDQPTAGTEIATNLPDLYAVSAASTTQAWAVGAQCSIAFHNGTSWIQQAVDSSLCPAGTTLRGVYADGGNPIAVGDGGIVLQCTANCTSATPTWTSTTLVGGSTLSANILYAVSGSSTSTIFAVGANCSWFSYNGTTWTTKQFSVGTQCASGTDLYGIDYSISSFGVIVGSQGEALLCTVTCTSPSNWNQQSLGTTNSLRGVSFQSATSGWVVGASCTVRNYRNGTWTNESPGTSVCPAGTDLYAVVAGNTANTESPTVVGDSGEIFACAGNAAACRPTTVLWTKLSVSGLSGSAGLRGIDTSGTRAWLVGTSAAAGLCTTLCSGSVVAGNNWTAQSSNTTYATSYTLTSSNLNALANQDSVLYTAQNPWPAAGLTSSCNATTPGLTLSFSPTVPSGGPWTITSVTATTRILANATPGTGAGFQLLVSPDGGGTWTSYALTSPGAGGAAASTTSTITSTIDTTTKLTNMRLCIQGTSGSGSPITTSLDISNVNVT